MFAVDFENPNFSSGNQCQFSYNAVLLLIPLYGERKADMENPMKTRECGRRWKSRWWARVAGETCWNRTRGCWETNPIWGEKIKFQLFPELHELLSKRHDINPNCWMRPAYQNKTDVERRQNLGHPRPINPNKINHVPKQSPLIF